MSLNTTQSETDLCCGKDLARTATYNLSGKVTIKGWSLIMASGGLYIASHLSRQGKTFRAPFFKRVEIFCPPFHMGKTYVPHLKTTLKLAVPPFSMASFLSG